MAFVLFGVGFAVGAAVALAAVFSVCRVDQCYDDPLMHLLDEGSGEVGRDGR